jgi:hypothetical protein
MTEVVEIDKKYNLGVVIGIPSRGTIDSRFLTHMLNFQMRLPTGISYKYCCPRGLPVDKARTKIVEYALEKDSKYIMFIDDDTFVPAGAIGKMMSADKDAISGIVWTKRVPSEPVIFEEVEIGPYFGFPIGEVFPIYAAGLACVLVKTDVFRRMKRPWFAVNWSAKDKKTGDLTFHKLGEDYHFWYKLKNMGIQAYADGSVFCDHLNVDIDTFYPGADPNLRKEIAEKLKKRVYQHS